MILTGTTLIAFFKTLSKPVEKIKEHADDVFEENEKREKEEDEEEGKLAKVTASSLRKLNVSFFQKSTEPKRPCGLFEGKQGHVYRISLI